MAVKPSKRVRSAISDLQYIKENYLHFFTCVRDDAWQDCWKKLENVENILVDLATDKKLNNIRLVQKLEMVKNIAKNSEETADK